MKKILQYAFRSIALVAVAAGAASCADDDEVLSAVQRDEMSKEFPSEVTLALQVPTFEEESLGSRGVDENAIATLTVLGYKADGTCLYDCTLSATELADAASPMGGNKTARLTGIPSGVTRIEVVANKGTAFAERPSQPLVSTFTNLDALSSAQNIPMWGQATMSQLLGDRCSISLRRQFAKVTLKRGSDVSAAFVLKGFTVANAACYGSIAPSATNDSEGYPVPNNLSSDPFNAQIEGVTSAYIYETPAEKPFILVKGTYNGAESWYKVAFYKSGTETKVNVRRNFIYTLTIVQVTAPGHATAAAALAGPVSNSIIAQLHESSPKIFNTVSANNYALGVADTIRVDSNGGTALLSASNVIILASDAKYLTGEPTAAPDAASSSWISAVSLTQNGTNTQPNASVNKTYDVKLTVSPNAYQSEPRYGKIVVKYNGLESSIVVAQEGTDFKRGTDRKVAFSYNGTKVTDDYFGWIDTGGIKGLKPADMQGEVRNEGLHFSTEKDVTKYSYSIAYKAGDSKATPSRSDIKVSGGSGNPWVVTLTATDVETTMWEGAVTITNTTDGHTVNVRYPVYRTGVFHNITTTTHQMQAAKITGWYYYETVKVTGTDGKVYYMLDRNVGASNNAPFSVASVAIDVNDNAVGAYFRIATGNKSGNLGSAISPDGFKVPGREEFTAIGFASKQFQSSSGNKFYSVYKTTAAGSKLSTVYLPAGGYLEGESQKNPSHINVWTTDFLTGAQGFGETAQEYGYWYYYFDSYGAKVAISNMRFVNGSSGSNGGIYRSMPVRCIRSTGGSSGGSTITVYLEAPSSWTQPKAYAWNDSETVSGSWPGDAMVKGTDGKWSWTVPAGKSTPTKIIFSDNGNNKTEDLVFVSGKTYTVASSTAQYLYLYNGNSWSKPCAHFWKNGGSAYTTWPGTAMTATGHTNYYMVEIPAGADRVIFSDNGSNQSADITFVAGKAYATNSGFTPYDYPY